MPTSLSDQLQAALGDAYRIERELAGGGMSRVFVATEVALGRQVVGKVLHPELAAEVTAERFAREIQLVARLQQANIVPLLTTGHTGEVPFYTMPFVEGLSLRQRIADRGPLAINEALGVLRDVARAPMRTTPGSCTATSSRRTCSPRAARRWSPTSASRSRLRLHARTPPRPRSRRPEPVLARRHTWRRNRRPAIHPWTTARTSMPSGASRTNSSLAIRRFSRASRTS